MRAPLVITSIVGVLATAALIIALAPPSEPPGPNAEAAPESRLDATSPTSPTSATSPARRCTFAVGDARRYAIEVDTGVTGQILGVPLQAHTEAPGAHDGAGFAATLGWSVTSAPGPRVWRFAAELATADASVVRFGFEFSDGCRFVRFGFGPDVPPDLQRLARGVLSGFEVALAAGDAWTARQLDAQGTYSADYRVVEGALVRSRSRYERLWDASPGSGTIVIERSHATITLAPDGRWLDAFVGEEHLRVALCDDDSMPARVTLGARLHRIAGGGPTTLPADVAWQLATSAPPALTTSAIDPRLADDLAALLTRLEAVRAEGSTGTGRAAELLARLLRLRPELASDLLAALRADTLPKPLRPLVFLGLELAGTPEAHSALATVIADAAFEEEDRARAVAALSDVPRPSQATFDALVAAAAYDPGPPSAPSAVPQTAAIALGTLEANARATSPALAADIRAHLAARMAETSDPVALGTTLAAIGNSGHGDFIAAIEPHLSDPSPYVRARAASAVRRMDPATTEDLFETAFDANRAANAPGQAQKALVDVWLEQAWSAGHPPTDVVIDAAIARLPDEPDPEARGALIRLIGAAIGAHSGARASLIAQFRREHVGPLLALIGQYVTAEELL